MSSCKDDVVGLIDEVLEFKRLLKRCYCKGVDAEEYECDNCKTKRVLLMAKVCIIQGADEFDLLKVRFIGVQETIIAKLGGIIKGEGNGGKNEE